MKLAEPQSSAEPEATRSFFIVIDGAKSVLANNLQRESPQQNSLNRPTFIDDK
jgi:hypothetical protein